MKSGPERPADALRALRWSASVHRRGTLEQEQEACARQRDAFGRWATVLLPAPDPVSSGDFSELVSAGQRVATICIDSPWVFERDRTWIDRRDAAKTRIVDQIYALSATYTGSL